MIWILDRTLVAGGGASFISTLRSQLQTAGALSGGSDRARFLVTNGHHFIDDIDAVREAILSGKILVHRIDGPMRKVRIDLSARLLDHLVWAFVNYFSSGIIFQSVWSKTEQIGMLRKNIPRTVIHNGCADQFFGGVGLNAQRLNKKKILFLSWSDNKSKGYEILRYLNEQDIFSNFEVDVYGNLDVSKLTNIKSYGPVPHKDMPKILSEYDIFLHASYAECCSNALIEAICAGLTPIARNNSSVPEIVDSKSLLYVENEDILPILEQFSLKERKELPKVGADRFHISTIAELYRAFITGCEQRDISYIHSWFVVRYLKLGFVAFRAVSRAERFFRRRLGVYLRGV